MIEKPDRVGKYLHKYANAFVFDELQENYLREKGIYDFMKGVPIPMLPQEVVKFHKEGGIQIMNVAQNMIQILGVNPEFRYAESYRCYLRNYFDETLVSAVIRDGEERAKKGETERALIFFRGALCLDEKNLYAQYDYALTCRELYQASEDNDYTGSLKAESIEGFELLTETHPDFAQGYYYLGYAYLNLGLYKKSELIFRRFLSLSDSEEDKKEITERLSQLSQPTKIEEGINHVLAARMEEGIQILEPFLKSEFETWWPLHYYLGIAYVGTSQFEEAINCFRRVLILHPSHTETMEELIAIYEAKGDSVMSKKYREKIALIQETKTESTQQ